MLLPRIPGPLVAVDAPAMSRRDELDEIVHELFGDPGDESPGRLDAVLLVAGALLIGWSLLGGASSGILLLGILALLLGAALPLRSARRTLRRRRAERRKERLLGEGYVVDTSDAAVRQLVAVYDELNTASTLPGIANGHAALRAGHMAISEVASLLDGGPPAVDAQVEYVARRTAAIETLVEELHNRNRSYLEQEQARLAALSASARLAASAKAMAREEVAALDPEDSLDELERVTQLVKQVGRGDA